MSVTPAVTVVLTPGASALSVTLPGGLVVRGVAHQVGATALTQALALIGAANAALAPLGPVFTLIDAMMSVKAFAESVPNVVTNAGAVFEAVSDLATKVGRLGSLIPQLSVPLMVVDIIDAVIALLGALAAELAAIEAQEARIAAARAAALLLPAGARLELESIAGVATLSIEVQRADIATTSASAGPLLRIVNIFCALIGIAGGSAEVDASSSASLTAAVTALEAFRRTIPV